MPISDRLSITIRLLEAQQNKCYYCQEPLEIHKRNMMHIDHMIPVSKGGSDNIDNLCLTCRPCNLAKNDKTAEEFYEYLKPYFLGIIPREQLGEYYRFKVLYKKWHLHFAKETAAVENPNSKLPPFQGTPPISEGKTKLRIDLPRKYFDVDRNHDAIFIFGKYRGQSLEIIRHKDKKYLQWMLNTFDDEVKRFIRQMVINYWGGEL